MKKFNIGSTPATTDVIYNPATGKLLAYASDYETIHSLLGGKRYYSSWSGKSSEGYVASLREWLPLGCYNVKRPWENFAKEVYPGLKVYIPWDSYNFKIDENYPVIIKVTENVPSIYLTSVTSLKDALENSLSYKDGELRMISDVLPADRAIRLGNFDFHYNLCGSWWVKTTPHILCFLAEELKSFELPWPQNDDLYLLTGYAHDETGNVYTYIRVGDKLYKRDFVEGDPFCEQHPKLYKGWELAKDQVGVALRYRETDTEYLSWADPREIYPLALEELGLQEWQDKIYIPNYYYCYETLTVSKLGIDTKGLAPEDIVRNNLMNEVKATIIKSVASLTGQHPRTVLATLTKNTDTTISLLGIDAELGKELKARGYTETAPLSALQQIISERAPGYIPAWYILKNKIVGNADIS